MNNIFTVFSLRQHALLDETEAAAAVCMLHHINLLQLVRDRAATGAIKIF